MPFAIRYKIQSIFNVIYLTIYLSIYNNQRKEKFTYIKINLIIIYY